MVAARINIGWEGRLRGLNLLSVGRDESVFLEFLVGLLCGELFGGFDGELYGVLCRFAVYFHTHIVLTAAVAALIGDFLHLEADLLVVFLSPVDELAFEIPVGVGHGIYVEVGAHDFLDDDATGELVAFLEIDGSNESFEGIAVNGLKHPLRLAVVLNQLREAYLLCQFVEVGAAYQLGTHLGEETFALMGIFFVEKFCHYGTEHCVAQIFEALVVDAPALPHIHRFGFVDEGYLVQLRVVGCESQHVLEE